MNEKRLIFANISLASFVYEILTETKILERLDTSDKFWENFNICITKLKKQVGAYALEVIGNPNMITIALNPKEYFEKYKDKNINEKHKV